MLLIMVIFMQYEDPVFPSSRLQALGTDFVQLIEDPITDVQIFPARLTFFERPTAYIYPVIPSTGMGGILTLTGGLLLPRAAGLSAGFWHTFSVYNTKEVRVLVDTVTHDIDSTQSEYSSGKQVPSLTLALPFLKEGGWAALKLAYHDAFWNSNNGQHGIQFDSTIAGDDTTYHCSDNTDKYRDDSGSPIWSVTLDQFLPLGDEALLDIALKYDNAEITSTYSDSSTSSYRSAYIFHFGDVHTADMYYNDQKDISSNQTTTKRHTFTLVGTFQRLPSWGILRIIGRFGYGFGSSEARMSDEDWFQTIDRYEYSDSDTSYAIADTQETHSTSSSVEKTDMKRLLAGLGTGLAYYGIENLGVFSGFKVNYVHDRDHPETGAENTQDSIFVIAPIGLEWFPVDCLCLRYGLRCTYQYARMENGGDSPRTLSSHQITGNSTIGFGLVAASHLRLDFFSKSGVFNVNKDWGLDLRYEF